MRLVIFIVVFCMFVAAGITFSGTKTDGDEVVAGEEEIIATVNGEKITVGDFRKKIELAVIPSARNDADTRSQVLESIIVSKLVYAMAVKEGFDKRPEMIEKLEEIKEAMIAQMFVEEKTLADVKITDKEVKKYYDEHEEEFSSPAQVRVSHILIKFDEDVTEEQKKEDKKKAQKALSRVKSGEDFSAVAKEVSTCPSSENGGDLNFFARGRMVPEFEDVAFSLGVGDLSEIVETRFGYHIIKVTDKKEQKKIDFEEYKDKIKDLLLQRKQGDVLKEWLVKIKSGADIEIKHDIMKKMKVDSEEK
ncbi:MAG: peptidylprolyl isomerase [Candidatus Aureabacteria bacterium]|nr:peptidylprolyl isomerase [Candidatus Auribacterota bacterium]